MSYYEFKFHGNNFDQLSSATHLYSRNSLAARSPEDLDNFLGSFAQIPSFIPSFELSFCDLDRLSNEEFEKFIHALSLIPGSIETFSLSNNRLNLLSPERLIALFKAIPKTIKTLDLRHNQLADLAPEVIAEAISHLPKSIDTLLLKNNCSGNLKEKQEALRMLFRSSTAPSSRTLCWSDEHMAEFNQLTSEEIKNIFADITSIDLSPDTRYSPGLNETLGALMPEKLIEFFAAMHQVKNLKISKQNLDTFEPNILVTAFKQLSPEMETFGINIYDSLVDTLPLILENLVTRQLKTLDLSYSHLYGLNRMQAEALGRAIPETLETLDLSNTIIKTEVAPAIFSHLRAPITTLNLSENQFPMSTPLLQQEDEHIIVFFAAILPTVSSLNISRTNLSFVSTRQITEAFSQLRAPLKKLDLSNNNLSYCNVYHIEEADEQALNPEQELDRQHLRLMRLPRILGAIPRTLKELNLSNNGLFLLSPATLTQAMNALPRLQKLNLSNNDLYSNLVENSSQRLLTIIQNLPEGIKELNLSNNHLHQFPASRVAICMKNLPSSLQVLNLSGNDLYKKSNAELIKIFKVIPKHVKVIFHPNELLRNRTPDEQAELIRGLKEHCPCFSKLNILDGLSPLAKTFHKRKIPRELLEHTLTFFAPTDDKEIHKAVESVSLRVQSQGKK